MHWFNFFRHAQHKRERGMMLCGTSSVRQLMLIIIMHSECENDRDNDDSSAWKKRGLTPESGIA